MGNDTKIVVDNITKIYKIYDDQLDFLKEAFSIRGKKYHTDFYALTDVSFRIAKGEIVGIMGRNGAGKSTLLKIITGILSPTTGKVDISGRISSLLELGAGFNLEYTGYENIYFYGTIMGLTKKEMDSKIDSIIEFAEIGDYIYQPVKTYSSGMFARLAFSCAINVEPEVLIVDEILSVGDIRFQAKCFKKFKEFKKKGVTILYVGHDIGTMRTFCDRCIWLDKGKVVDSGDPAYVSAKYVEYMYLDDVSSFTSYEATKHKKDKKDSSKEYNEPGKVVASDENAVVPTGKDSFEEKARTNTPLAHWGKKTNVIQNLSVTCDGKDFMSCGPWDDIKVSFFVPYLEDIDYEHLSAAISIKNRDGQDLTVQTTFDKKIEFSKEKSKNGLKFSFYFKTRLTNGSYYLVVALEDRTQTVTSYYEYIEGAKYFKVFQPEELYGVFYTDYDIVVESGN